MNQTIQWIFSVLPERKSNFEKKLENKYVLLYNTIRIKFKGDKMMATVKAFPALRFTAKAGDISKNVCPPYDIISPRQREEYISESENNIIRLELPVGENAYEDAGALYKKMRADKILDNDATPGIYVYEEEFSVNGEVKRIKGIFVRVKLCEFSENVVLPHEETLSKAKTDRFNLMSATFCNFSPIYSMYSDESRQISGKVAELTKNTPEIEFTCADGVTQRLWKIEQGADTDFIEHAFEDKQLFIADGHHRYETALNFRRKLVEDGIIKSDSDAGNYVMMMLIDMENDGLVVFPTHRLVRGLENFDAAKSLEKISEYFEVTEIKKNDVQKSLAENVNNKAFVFCTKPEIYHLLVMKDNAETKKALDLLNPGKSNAYKGLDVTVLHSLILEKIFGIDKENMANQVNLKYTRDFEEACECANSDEYNCSFILNATKVSEIKDVALAGEKMPQKSTYFYPKLITGLVMNELVPVDEI